MNVPRVIQQDHFHTGRGADRLEQFRPVFRLVIGHAGSIFDGEGIEVPHFGRYLVSDYRSEVTERFGRTLVRGEISMVVVIGSNR